MARSSDVPKVILVAVVLHAVFTVGLPWFLLASTDSVAWVRVALGPARWLGFGGIGLGVYLYVWAVVRLASRQTSALPLQSATALETDGWYAVVRHPLLLGVVVILLGEAMIFESVVLFTYALTYWLAVDRFVARREEAHLHASFGDSYHQYATRVPRWIPRAIRR